MENQKENQGTSPFVFGNHRPRNNFRARLQQVNERHSKFVRADAIWEK